MTDAPSGRLQVHRNPLRMFFSAGPWAATGYLASYIPLGSVMFSIAVAVVVSAYALSITWLGLPLLVGAAWIVRGCAQVERARSMLVTDQVVASYRSVTAPGLFAQIKTRWSDPTTRRDCAYLILMYPLLLVLDAVALVIWLTFLSGVALPLWYWSIPQTWHNGVSDHGILIGYLPNGPHSDGGFGVWVGDLPTALMASAVFFLLSLLGAYLVTGVARLHGTVARSLLGPRIDPLAAAKRMLAEPGPLNL